MKPIALADAGVQVLDCEHKTPAAQDSGFPYIAIPDIQDGRVVLDRARRISAADLTAWTRRTRPQGGDLLVTRRGRVGDTAPIPEGLDCAIGQNLVLLRSSGGQVCQAYLRWAAHSPQWWSEVDRLRNVGAVFSSLNVRDISRIRLSFPPLSEQHAIAEVLGALEDKIAANTKLAETSECLASSTYSRGVKGQPMQPMSALLRPILGGTPSRTREDYWGGSRLWISARDITGAPNHIVVDTEEKITDLAVQTTKAKPLPTGSIVLTARGTVGAVARLAEPASFNQSCYGFEPGPLPSSMLYFTVLSATERAKAMAHGSVFDTITMSTFEHLEIPSLTPSAVAGLEDQLSPLLSAVAAAVRENRTLAATRDTLLPQLMSGKLRVKNAEALASEAGA